MKAIYLMIATLVMMSLASCTASENDPAEDYSSAYVLMNTYGARSVSGTESGSDKLNLNDLPAMSVSEANTILAGIRKHEASQKESNVYAAASTGKSHLKIVMTEKVCNKYTFAVQLNMLKYDDGQLLYKGYEMSCESSMFRWYSKGTSFSCDNSNIGNYKFQSETYLYFKIVDDGVKYMQVPVSIRGTYNPENHQADFTYNL